MNQVETAELLVLISQYNGMKVDKAKAIAWHDLAGHLDFEEARAGVMHYFRSGKTEWLQPGHLFAAVKEARATQQALERSQVARETPQIAPTSTFALSGAEKAQARSERVHSPEVAAALAEARAKLRPSRRDVFDAPWKVKYRGDGAEVAEESARGRAPERLGGLLRVVSSQVEASGVEAA